MVMSKAIPNSIHEKIAAEVPQLRRGTVWCYTCGREERVDSAASLKHGWPTCCGSTMSIDSPEERQRAEQAKIESVLLDAVRKIASTDLSGCADMTTAEIFGALSRMHETARVAVETAERILGRGGDA